MYPFRNIAYFLHTHLLEVNENHSGQWLVNGEPPRVRFFCPSVFIPSTKSPDQTTAYRRRTRLPIEIPFSTYRRYSKLCVKGKRTIHCLFTDCPKYRKRIFIRLFDIFHKDVIIVYNFFVCLCLCGSVANFVVFRSSQFAWKVWHITSVCREKTQW